MVERSTATSSCCEFGTTCRRLMNINFLFLHFKLWDDSNLSKFCNFVSSSRFYGVMLHSHLSHTSDSIAHHITHNTTAHGGTCTGKVENSPGVLHAASFRHVIRRMLVMCLVCNKSCAWWDVP